METLFAQGKAKVVVSAFWRDAFAWRMEGHINLAPQNTSFTHHFLSSSTEINVHFRKRVLRQIEDHGHLTVGLLDLLHLRSSSLSHPETCPQDKGGYCRPHHRAVRFHGSQKEKAAHENNPYEQGDEPTGVELPHLFCPHQVTVDD